MVTCFLKYTIDPYQISEFEFYGKTWIGLVNEMGGVHHGYLLPFEGANNIAYASFSFESLAEYESYREEILTSEKCKEILNEAAAKKYILSYERSFMKPLFEGFEDKTRI